VEIKQCSKCGEEKPVDEFYVDRRVKHSTGRLASCKDCCKRSERLKMENPETRERRLAKMRATGNPWRKDTIAANKAFVQKYLEDHPCVDCGIDDWRVLEFDHVRGEKYKHVSALIAYNIQTLIDEIVKCDVRCANCHRIKTYQRADHWRAS